MEISNAIFRLLLRRIEVELDGGGGGVHTPPPGQPRKFLSAGPARVNPRPLDVWIFHDMFGKGVCEPPSC